MNDPRTIPTRLDLKKDQKLEIQWQDGQTSIYSLSLLRTMCPCAQCKMVREQTNPHDIMQPAKKSLLTILPGNFAEPLKVKNAQLIGNYALKIEWSDGHESGIYSFHYLRSISAPGKAS